MPRHDALHLKCADHDNCIIYDKAEYKKALPPGMEIYDPHGRYSEQSSGAFISNRYATLF